MPCVVKACGRRGADGGDRSGFLVAAWVTQSSYGSGIEPYIGVNVANYQMPAAVIASGAKQSIPPRGIGGLLRRFAPRNDGETRPLAIPQPRRGAAPEHRNPVHRE